MHNYVSTNKHDLFEHGTDALFDGLDKIAEAVGFALEDALNDLADKVSHRPRNTGKLKLTTVHQRRWKSTWQSYGRMLAVTA